MDSLHDNLLHRYGLVASADVRLEAEEMEIGNVFRFILYETGMILASSGRHRVNNAASVSSLVVGEMMDSALSCLQCFDTVSWRRGKTSGLLEEPLPFVSEGSLWNNWRKTTEGTG